jgi:asparagine synthase (glutamine-hydrolysing)
MCGICGTLDLEGQLSTPPQEIEAMARALAHRGPDDAGYYSNPPINFGFRRLSIIDLTKGHQPMSNEDGTVWIVFNGEIYNHAVLRRELEQRGHRYSTQSDTETVIHLYEEYADDCVHQLRGMFTFSIWDVRKRRLLCARDRLGIKPFYYAMTGGRFVFASEIKALLELSDFRPQLNHTALPEFFSLGYLSGAETLFQGVYKLLPGHRLIIEANQANPRPIVQQYWDLNVNSEPSQISEEDCVAQFRQLFTESVQLRLMSDVPVGVFLSGGLDSSAIAATVAKLSRDPIKTFSVGYQEDRFSELPYARHMAEHIGAEHQEITLTPDDFFSSLPKLIWHEDEPIAWPSSVPLYFVSRLAGQKVKVALSGEGGDELFAGYTRYAATLFNCRYGSVYEHCVPSFLRGWVRSAVENPLVPKFLQRKLCHSFLYYPNEFEKIYLDNFCAVFSKSQQSQLFVPSLADRFRNMTTYGTSIKFFQESGKDENLLSRLLYLDIKTYLVELLMRQDQMSMAASIESRVPFLDHKLVEFAMKIPAQLKLRHMSGKYLLRRAMEDRLPRAIVRRGKMGFPTPMKLWFRYHLFDQVATILTDGRLAQRGILNAAHVSNLLKALSSGHAQLTDAVWRLLNFELWCRIFLDRDPTLV